MDTETFNGIFMNYDEQQQASTIIITFLARYFISYDTFNFQEIFKNVLILKYFVHCGSGMKEMGQNENKFKQGWIWHSLVAGGGGATASTSSL